MISPLARTHAEPDGVWAQSAKIAFRFLFGAVGLIALGWAVSNIRQVQPDHWAVVLRFGNIVRQHGAGLLIAWPRPIEEVLILPSADQQIEMRITRFDGDAEGSTDKKPPVTQAAEVTQDAIAGFAMSDNPRLNTGFLLTGDSSVVHLQATLFYQISDPAAYVIAAEHVPPALERLFIASAVALCAGRDLDTILVARPELNPNGEGNFRASREQLRSDLMRAVNRRLEDLAEQGSGLGVTVAASISCPRFRAVRNRSSIVSSSLPRPPKRLSRTPAPGRSWSRRQANQETDSIITEATAAAKERVADAVSHTATIDALADQMPEVSRQTLFNRIYFARVGALLSRMGVVETFDGESANHIILPGPRGK